MDKIAIPYVLSGVVLGLLALGAIVSLAHAFDLFGQHYDTKGKPWFADGQAAVRFIAEAIEKHDQAALLDACVGMEPGDGEAFPRIFETLQAVYAGPRFQEVFRAYQFPKGKSAKLGGHGDEWGHVHIDFVKQGGKWYLMRFWVCR